MLMGIQIGVYVISLRQCAFLIKKKRKGNLIILKNKFIYTSVIPSIIFMNEA